MYPLKSVIVKIDHSYEKWSFKKIRDREIEIWVRGYAFTDEGQFVNGSGLANYIADKLRGNCDRSKLKSIIPRLNGSWAILARWEDGDVLAATDRHRSIPIYYRRSADQAIVASTPELIIQEEERLAISEPSAGEVLLSGYVSGANTLYDGIFKVRGSEIIEFKVNCEDAIIASTYFDYFLEPDENRTDKELSDELEEILCNIFTRFAGALQGRRILLPLSGGYDSRLIALMLNKFGIRNVLCYTYGAKGNPQTDIAKRVAESLNFEWRPVVFDPALWDRCMSSQKMAEYWVYAFRGTSVPHIQDFPVFVALQGEFKKGEPPVVLPGHVGDAWASEFALQQLGQEVLFPLCETHSPRYTIRDNPVVSTIIYRHLNLWPLARSSWDKAPWTAVVDRILEDVLKSSSDRKNDVIKYMEWVIANRTSLLILRSLRCVEFFGGESWQCLADNSLVDFFRRLPLARLMSRNLYASTLRDRIFVNGPSAFREIPLRSGASGGKSRRRIALELIHRAGAYGPYEQLRRKLKPPCALESETWFTRGAKACDVSIGKAFQPHHVVEELPDALTEVIAPHLRRRAYCAQYIGMLAAVVLAKEYARWGK